MMSGARKGLLALAVPVLFHDPKAGASLFILCS